ncbi:MAG: hypothetical protein ACE5FB_01305, partial [Candidatus Binatia bacterium]
LPAARARGSLKCARAATVVMDLGCVLSHLTTRDGASRGELFQVECPGRRGIGGVTEIGFALAVPRVLP